MLSYWEQESFAFYHHIVVGAGIVGLSAAIELKERHPNDSVLVLERGLLPTGASTRNAGFACMGSATELLDDLNHSTEQEVVHLFEKRRKGLELLKSRLGERAIGYAQNGSYELISDRELYATEKIDYLNNLLQEVTGGAAFRLVGDDSARFGFSSQYMRCMIENVWEGELHTGKMMRELTDLAIKKGIEIKTGAEALRFEEDSKGVRVFIKDSFAGNLVSFDCERLLICTNAFTKQLLPDVDLVPGRGQVLITEPIEGLKFKGIYHFDKGFYYFREIDGRVLFGGGRNLDFKTEVTIDFSFNEMIQADLEQKLTSIILPGQPYKVARRWTGIMAFGSTKKPIIQVFSNRVAGAFRMGGMGVALGSTAARELVNLIDCQ